MTNTLSLRMIFGMLVPWENTSAQIEFRSVETARVASLLLGLGLPRSGGGNAPPPDV